MKTTDAFEQKKTSHRSNDGLDTVEDGITETEERVEEMTQQTHHKF